MAAGDELRKYLIVPSQSSSSFQDPLSSQAAGLFLGPQSRPDTPRFHKSAVHKAETDNMEVDNPSQLAPLVSAHTSDVVVPLEGVMSLDDFLSAHQADHDAYVAAREKVQPAAKKLKTSNDANRPQPVAVGARSSKYTILLNEKSQALAIPQPAFEYEGDGVTKFKVTVSFPGLDNAEELQGLRDEGLFNSKQEAKEAVSKTAVEILERLVEEGRVQNRGKAKKPKGEPLQQLPKEKEEPGENYVGQLLGTYIRASQASPNANTQSSSAQRPALSHPTPTTSLAADGHV